MTEKTLQVEDATDLIVGEFYLVNTVARKRDRATIPVHGPLHEDKEILKFPDRHWHIDWRFLSKRLYADVESYSMGYSMPWEQPISFQNTTGTVTRLRLRCQRLFGDYPPVARIKWFGALQEKYRDAKMKNDFICPHKGLPCNSTPVKDGIVVCRGHGLAFNVTTGELVEQPHPATPTQRRMF